MKDLLKQIESATRSLKLKLPFTPECDPAHDLIDRIIELCGQAEPTDRALEMLRARHEGVESACISQYEVSGKWLAVRIPKHQPIGQQIQWCASKGATLMEVTMKINGSGKMSTMIETFNINDFK